MLGSSISKRTFILLSKPEIFLVGNTFDHDKMLSVMPKYSQTPKHNVTKCMQTMINQQQPFVYLIETTNLLMGSDVNC